MTTDPPPLSLEASVEIARALARVLWCVWANATPQVNAAVDYVEQNGWLARVPSRSPGELASVRVRRDAPDEARVVLSLAGFSMDEPAEEELWCWRGR